ncbi:hypothetical protein CMI37_23825 [Candidatus Pacearchaeota archaeon]|nr:hypothetical protein [Candidatus Pacearchaeota archaeon]
MKQDLKNVAALSGGSVAEVIRGAIKDTLYTPRIPTINPTPRAHRVSGSKYSINKIQPKKEANAASGVPLPADFAPPESIARNARLDHPKTLAAFRNLHLSNSTLYEDWEVAYRYFCSETAQKSKYAHLHAAQPSVKRFDQPMRD